MKETLTKDDIRTLERMLGRLEGIAFVTENEATRETLLDAVEVLNPIIDRVVDAYE